MILMLVVALIISKVKSDSCPGIIKHENIYEKRLTSIMEGNYTIQVLTTLSGTSCTNVTRVGLIRAYAIKYGIDRANNMSNLNQWATIGMRLDDVCQKLPVTMARGIEVVSLLRPNSVCRSDFLQCRKSGSDIKSATGIIGTSMSFTTIPLASLMSLYQIPQISYAASSRLLSKTDLYKSFFRTIPSDINQVSVMLDIFETFNWNFIFAVGSDDDYGKLGIAELKTGAENRNICITENEYIPYGSKQISSTITKVVTKIKNKKAAKVVVLFCYLSGMGDLILTEAKRQNVERIWLTSDAWNPSAEQLRVDSLLNQSHGILSVSLKRHPMPYFIDYMKYEVETNFKCNMWLRNYMWSTYGCAPEEISDDKSMFYGTGNCTIPVKDVLSQLSKLPGKTSNTLDAVNTLTEGIYQVLKKNCTPGQACFKEKIDPAELTQTIKTVSFTNQQGEKISFDEAGDPTYIFYAIDNLQFINGSLKFVTVGNWSKNRGNKFIIERDRIKWPYWFENSDQTSPFSRCNADCLPGQFVSVKIGCCWTCENCSVGNISTTRMASTCTYCGEGNHTVDHITCETTPILWMNHTNTEGMAIVIVSGVGFLFSIVATFYLIALRQVLTNDEYSSYLVFLSCALLNITFAFGFLHIFKPSDALCQTRSALFFLVIMSYSALLLIKSRVLTEYLEGYAKKYFNGNLHAAQTIFLLLLLLVEVGSIIAWIIIDGEHNIVVREPKNFTIELRCFVDLTAARLVSNFIPCIVLIIATFFAFRERNLEHSFYEPKFLSFTCIALCIITVAFLPTFKYVKGDFKTVVMAFTTSVFAYTYMACLILPKVYVGHMRKRNSDAFRKSDHKDSAERKEKRSSGVIEVNASSDFEISTSVCHDLNSSYGNIDQVGTHVDNVEPTDKPSYCNKTYNEENEEKPDEANGS